MAGDWIKMRTDLREDPAVFRMASMLTIDRYAVVGRLHAFWSWWDANARNGRVDGAVTVAVDDVTNCAGFGDALLVVLWLGQDDKGLFIPYHERHNGRAAKERAQGNQRQKVYRGRNGKRNAQVTRKSRSRDGLSVTREEKSSSNKHPTVEEAPSRSDAPRDEKPSTATPPLATPIATPPSGLTPSEFAKQAIANGKREAA